MLPKYNFRIVETFHMTLIVKRVLDIFLEVKMKISRSREGDFCAEFKPADSLKIQSFVSKSWALSPFNVPRHVDNIGFIFVLPVDFKMNP